MPWLKGLLRSRKLHWTVGIFSVFVALALMAWPVFQTPPWYINSKRTLNLIWNSRWAYLTEDSQLLEETGRVTLKGRVINCPTCECPFVWHTRPPSGDPILFGPLDEKTERKRMFFVASEKPDSWGGWFFLFNNGIAEYLRDDEVDWSTQTKKTKQLP